MAMQVRLKRLSIALATFIGVALALVLHLYAKGAGWFDEHHRLQREYRWLLRTKEAVLLRPLDTNNNDKNNNRNNNNNGPEPRGAKILIVTACDKKRRAKHKAKFNDIRQNRDDYAAHHGYQHVYVDTSDMVRPGEAAAWAKVDVMRKVLDEHPEVEWAWWLDVDAIIMNETIDLATHLLNPAVLRERVTWGWPARNEDYVFTRRLPTANKQDDDDVDKLDILVTHDNMGWNCGSMFFRNRMSTLATLDKWSGRGYRGRWWRQLEQSAFTNLAFSDDAVFERIGTVPQRLINAYYKEPQQYRRGDFVLHFAGVIKKHKKFEKYWQQAYHHDRIRAK